MSFFLSKVRKAKKPAAQGVARSTRAVQTLRSLGCKACPLDKAKVHTPKMQPTIAQGASVYFLAEAPGRDEDENSGRPLTGPSGSLLRDCIPSGFSASFDNVVRDRPPENRTPTWQEIECCRGYVTASIEATKPRLIVGLGVIPLSWMLASQDLSGMRGRLFAVRVGTHSCYFMPTYHPSFILRIAHDRRKPLQSKFGHCFRLDIQRAVTLAPNLPTPAIPSEAEVRDNILTFRKEVVPPSKSIIHAPEYRPQGHGSCLGAALLDLLEQARKAPVKSIDIETQGLRPYGTGALILTVAISFNDINFAFEMENSGPVYAALETLLKDDTIKVAHNAPFELEWFIHYFGLSVVNHGAWECTQMQAHFLDERRGKQAWGGETERRASYQGLNFLVRQHFGVAYKGMFKLDKKNMAASDINEVLTYNAVDTKYTLRLWHRQTELLQQAGLHDAYLEALPRQPTVALMQALGVDTHQPTVKRIQGQLAGEITAIETEIQALEVVQAYVADHGEFNPLGRDALVLFRDYLKCKEVQARGKDSIDKHILAAIDHPLAAHLIKLRNRTKLKSTYVDTLEVGSADAVVWADGKLHTSFNTTFAETGRTSSDGPNMQNFPQRADAWVRQQVVAPHGHYLVAFDYGQLEACTAAMCSKDPYLVKVLWDDYDTHMEWARKTVARYPEGCPDFADPKAAKAFRSRIKNKLVFPAFFGAQNTSIAAYLGFPDDVIDDLMEEFWETFSGYKAWQDQLMAQYYELGFVAAPTGRRHHYPLSRNQAINHPVQCLAAEIVCEAMSSLSYRAASTKEWHLHPRLNIHDDLTFVVPDNKLEDSIETIYRVMLQPPWKHIVNVPMSVSASLGRNWFQMKEIGKFWSHKDL